MKKRLLSLALTLAMLTGLCMGTTVTASADTWTITGWEKKGEPETGLKMFTEKRINPARWSADGKGVLQDSYGLKDAAGNIVLPADYLALEYLGPNRLLAAKPGSHSGVITLNGEVIYPFTASQIEAVEIPGSDKPLLIIGEGIDIGAIVRESSIDAGLYDWNGQAIIPKGTYKSIWSEGEKYFVLLHKNGLQGLYEYGAGITIPCQYKYVSNRGNTMFLAVNSDLMCGAFDKNGQQILPFEYENIMAFQQGCFIIGKFIDPDSRGWVSHGGSIESDKVYCALIDGYGKYLIPFEEYESIYIDDAGYVHGGDWSGKYRSSLSGSNGGTGKIYNYTYHVKLSDLLAEKGGTALPVTTPTTETTSPTERPSASARFKDVRNSDYFADAVAWAMEKNITSGTSATTFSPNATCSRAQILTFLWRANGSPDPTTANPFTDIKPSDYYYKAALWAAEKGLVSGSTFAANTDCTRAMTVEYMWKAAGSPAPDGKASFTDVPADADYASAVAWAVEQNVTSGTGGGKFSPAATCTRGQIVTFLYRAMGQ